MLAVDVERSWLLLGDAGAPLGIGGDPEPWLEVLSSYAELQRGETGHVAAHLDRGVPDRRLASFPGFLDALVAAAPGVRPPRSLLERCRELAAYGIPETVQHDDLHGANVYAGRGIRILDWGDDDELRRAYDLAQELAPYAHAFKEVLTLGELPDWVRPLLGKG